MSRRYYTVGYFSAIHSIVTGEPINVYRSIRPIRPLTCFLWKEKILWTVGASPEVHVRLDKNDVLIRPIAGTRPRGADEEEDHKNEQSLLMTKKKSGAPNVS